MTRLAPLPRLRRPALALAPVLLAALLSAQDHAPRLPFSPGEELVYQASGRLGRFGRGTMSVAGPEMVDGTAAYVLNFDFRGRIALVGMEDRSRSWVDPDGLKGLRFTKRERSPVSRKDVDVRFDADAGRWHEADGDTGPMTTDAPLDELSFLYFLRTLPLDDGAELVVRRHYEEARNPVEVRVAGRRAVQTPAGTFETVEVEMRVRDPERYGARGYGTIRLFLTDDARRIPVRIESSAPVLGRMVLSLVSHTPGRLAS